MSRSTLVTLSVVVVAASTLLACGSDGTDSTTGKRITLHTNESAEAATKTTFTTGFGYDVTLTKAAIATSGLYYFDGPPPTAMFQPKKPTLGERFASLFIGTAYAHPGHYQAGTALGQVILAQPMMLDLFATSTALPDGDGITGTYRSARFVIPQTAPADAVLAGHVAIAEGKALNHKDPTAAAVYFRLVADYADISASVNNGAVDGCVLDEVDVTDSGSVALQIRPTIWLNLVDFSKIAPGTETAPTEARDAGFSQGVTELSAYHFTYTK